MNLLKFFLVSPFVVAGCAGQAGGNWIGVNTPADAGPVPQNYEETARNWIKTQLRDPDSLKQFNASYPIKTSCSIGVYGPFWGWRVATTYNAKNAYGGYVGQRIVFLWFHGERIAAWSADPSFCPSIKATM